MTNENLYVTVKLLHQLQEGKPFIMKTITQTMLYRQALIRYAQKYGVTKAAIRYKTNRQYFYRWIKRYKGTLASLADKSHRKDNEYFYATHSFYSFDHFKKQLAVHNRKYNLFPIRPLHWKSPAHYIKAYIISGEVF